MKNRSLLKFTATIILNGLLLSASGLQLFAGSVQTSGIDRTEVWLYEGFDHELFPPPGWQRFNQQGASRQWVRTNAFTYEGEGSAMHTYHASEYQESWLVSPQITLGDNSTLSFWDYTLNEAWYVYSGIWVSTGSADPADGDYIELSEIADGTMTWTARNIDMGAFDNQQVHIAFLYEGLDAHIWYVDEVYVYSASDKPGPAMVCYPKDGGTHIPLNATLEWKPVDVGAAPDGYRINLGSDFPPTNIENNTDLGSATTFTPENMLDFATTYYWQLIPYNAAGDSPENPVWSFTTGPDPSLTAPHFEDFDAVNTPELPYMWQKILNHSSSVARVRTTHMYDPYSDPNHVEMYNTLTADPEGMLMVIPPAITVFEGHNISFFARSSQAGSLLVTGTMTDPNDADSFVPADQITLTENYEEYVISLDAYSGGGDYFAFQHGDSGGGSGQRIVIDDFGYYEATPYPGPAFVVSPQDEATLVLPKSHLEWAPSPGEVPDGYLLRFGTDFPPSNIEDELDMGDFTIYQPEVVLQPNTLYYWQIIPYNTAGSPPQTPIWSFTTGPDPTLSSPHYQSFDDIVPPALPYGWHAIVIHSNIFASVRSTHDFDPYSYPYHVELFNTFYEDTGDPHLMLISPEINAFAGHQIRFFAKASSSGLTLEIGTMTDPDDAETFIGAKNINLTNIYEEYTVLLDDFDQSGSHLAFRHGNPGGGQGLRITLDDFVYESLGIPNQVLLAYPENQQLFEMELTEEDIMIKWHLTQPNVSHYQLDIANDYDFTQMVYTSDQISDTSHLFTIQPQQTYYWRVRAQNEHGWGAYSQIWSFSTLLVGIEEVMNQQVTELHQNMPNPFLETTTIPFTIAHKSHVLIQVFDNKGKYVSTIFNRVLPPGEYTHDWAPDKQTSGIFYVIMTAHPLHDRKNPISRSRIMLRIE